MSDRIKHPFWQSLIILAIAYVLIAYGIPLLPGSSLVPKSVVLQYMLTVLAGVLLWVSDSEERWVRFKEPIHAVLVEPQLKGVRTVLLGAVPLFIGFLTFRQVQASVSAPPTGTAVRRTGGWYPSRTRASAVALASAMSRSRFITTPSTARK